MKRALPKRLRVDIPWESVGGPSLLEPRFTFLIVLISFISSLTAFNGSTTESWALWSASNLISFAVLALPIVLFWRFRRLNSDFVLPFPWVLVTAFCLGAGKSFLVNFSYRVLSGGTARSDSYLDETLVGGVLGLIAIPMFSIAALTLRELSDLQLAVTNTSRSLPNLGGAGLSTGSLLEQLSSDVKRFLRALQSREADNLNSGELEHLKRLIENSVRPTSVALWQLHVEQPGAPSAITFLKLAMGKKLWITPALVPVLIGTVLSRTGSVGFPAALWETLQVGTLSYCALLGMNRWASFRLASPVWWFASALVLAGLFPPALMSLISIPIEWASFKYFVGYISVLGVGLLVSSAASLISERKSDLKAELHRLRESEMALESEKRLQAKKRANQVHGEVQSKLVSQLLLAESGRQITRKTMIFQLTTILSTISSPVPQDQGLDACLNSLQQRWRGFLEIELIGVHLVTEPRAQSLVYLVIEEACHNAFRHGLADQCKVEVASTGEAWLILVSDNGVGVRGGKAGLGSAVFAEIDPEWQLASLEAGGSQLLVSLPYLAFDGNESNNR